jgi:CRP-like cAMP-binding protein
MTVIQKTHRPTEFISLRPEELAEVGAISGEREHFPKHHVILRQGDCPSCVFLLDEGWAAACVVRRDGSQHVTKFHLKGDLVGAPSMALANRAESFIALTPVSLRRIELSDFMRLFEARPRFAAAMFLSAQRERVSLMDALTNLGRASALQRLCWVLVDFYHRLAVAGLVEQDRFHLPITQERLADYLGMTAVHLNRMIRTLRQAQLVEWDRTCVRIPDVVALAEAGLVTCRQNVAAPRWLEHYGV